MKILAIDTSCDETSAAVTEDTKVLSNVIWSQASAHARFGGVMPSVAQRMHSEHIEWVVERALTNSHLTINQIDAIAVTIGPGLSIALGVGISKAKEIAEQFKKPLLAINHVEAHLLSPPAKANNPITQSTNNPINFPAFGLCLSGGNTIFVLIEKVGKYKVLAETQDDALGEALDKAARLLGFGYPGAAVLEKVARDGDSAGYKLPVPLIDDKIKNRFSYSGLKTAFVRLVGSIKNPSRQDIADLAASFQEVAFKHIENVLNYQIVNSMGNGKLKMENLLLGGGVANNIELRRRLRKLCGKNGLKLMIPYSKKLLGDNAAMIGVVADLKVKHQKLKLKDFMDYSKVDRNPNLKLSLYT